MGQTWYVYFYCILNLRLYQSVRLEFLRNKEIERFFIQFGEGLELY